MDTKTIALVGTSLITSDKDRGWSYYLRRYLQIGAASTVSVITHGQSGGTSIWGLANIQKVIDLRPSIYVIEFINDANPTNSSMTVAKSVQNYTDMVTLIRNQHSGAVIYFMALVRPRADAASSTFPNLAALDAAHANLATSLDVGFIDTRAAWGDPALHPEEFDAGDGTHALIAGYLRVVLPTIKTAIAALL